MTGSHGDVPARDGYGDGDGDGCYRRRLVLERTGNEVRGELADDFHHFAVRLRHNGEVVLEVIGEDVRVPWTTCPSAIVPLRRMEGAQLSTPLLELVRHTPAREQCTHLHDLTCLAITHAARAGARTDATRRYDVAVPDRVARVTRSTLARDGHELLRWRSEGTRVVEASPERFAGSKLGGADFRDLLLAEPDPELAEAAWILQRAVFIALGRQHDFERMHEAATFAPLVTACHTFDPRRLRDAKRVYGSVRDFSSHPERILDREDGAR